MSRGVVYLVGAGPGDPGLVTWKGLEILRAADVVVYDRLVGSALLAQARSDAEVVDVGKKPGDRALSQEGINDLLVAKARAGLSVCRLKGGDPFVFGRGGEEALALLRANIPFVVVPGVTSALAVPAYAGIPVTHRGMVRSFAVVTGHRCDEGQAVGGGEFDGGFPSADTLVFLMGVSNLKAIVGRLLETGWAEGTPAALVGWGTTSRQATLVGTLADIVEKASDMQPPAVFVVGPTVGLRDSLSWFEHLPLFGKRVLVTRAREQASSMAAKLMALGAEPLILPSIAILPPESTEELDGALQRLHEFDWVVFTSANAVRLVWDRVNALGLDARAFAGVRLGAIGSATGAAMLGRGLRADFVPQRHTSEAMVTEIGSVRGQRILLPRSDIAPPDLAEGLGQKGAEVEAVVAYRTAPARPQPEILEELAQGQVDIATFTSSSTVANLSVLVAPRSLGEVLEGCFVACIGPVTTSTARQLGVRVDLVAEVHTVDGLVEALVAHFGAGKSGKF